MQLLIRTLIRIFVLICLVTAVPFPTPATAAERKKPVRILYVEWPCAVASSNLVKAVIEDKLGRPCQLLPVSAAIIFQALALGEGEATVTAWLPDTHGGYWEKTGHALDDLGTIMTGARIGLVVPSHLPYASIEELKGKAGEFNGKIYGIDPGAGLMISAEKAIAGYGLEGFSLVEGSDAVMVSILADAIRRKEPVVVTGWAPHWKFGRWDLRFLDDPKGFFGAAEEIHAIGRKGLKEDMPEVHAFLQKFSFTNAGQLQKLMAENEEKGATPLENARKFIRENPEQVNKWLQ